MVDEPRGEMTSGILAGRVPADLIALPDLFFEVDPDGIILDYRAPRPGALDAAPERFLGRRFSDVLPESAARIIHDAIAEASRTGQHRGSTYALDSAGETRWYELSILGLGEERPPLRLAVVVREVTERVRTEEDLRRTAWFLLESQRVSRLGSYDLDVARGVWTNSPMLDEIFGIDAAFARDVASWQSLVHPDDRASMGRYFLEDVIGRRQPFDRQYRIVRVADGATRWVHGRGELEFGADGAPEHMIGTIRDVTEEREARRRELELEDSVRQAQKLESLGVLAGGIAHDFNNVLMAIMGYADLARRDLPPGSPAAPKLMEIVRASHQASDLCRQLLAYSGRGQFVVGPVDLSRLVDETRNMLEISLGHRATLCCRLGTDLPPIEGDTAQLRQVLMNLVLNAGEAIGDAGGEVTVTTTHRWYDRARLDERGLGGEMDAGDHVVLEVSDTGCGMEPDTVARIFDPFFSTKFAGRGLGLAAVIGIVRGHHGAIRVDTRPGHGTTFTLLFPARAGRAPAEPKPEGTASTWRGSGGVLLVEDDDTIRAVCSQMLANLGFGVVTAADGREALLRFRERRADIRCVLLDLTMPGMSGEETFDALRALDGRVPIVVNSGFSQEDVAARFTGKGMAGFLQKPYRLDDLGAALRRVLEPS
jgi:two-component system cell cycle sensor histidine kinase/response regulator CckA